MRRTSILLAFVMAFVAACSASATTGVPQSGGAQTGPTQTVMGATDNPTAGVPQTLDVCSLITADEAAAALGKPVDPGKVPTPGVRSCIFVDSAKATDSVEISIKSVADFKPTQKSIPGLTITPVSGVGDGAYYMSMGPGMVILNVRKGQTAFSTSMLLKGASDSQLMAGEKTLALAALGRM